MGKWGTAGAPPWGREGPRSSPVDTVGAGSDGDAAPSPTQPSLLGWEGRTAYGTRTPPETPELASQAGGRAGETGNREMGKGSRRKGQRGSMWHQLRVPGNYDKNAAAVKRGRGAGPGLSTLSALRSRAVRPALPTCLKLLGLSAASPLDPESPSTPRNTGRAAPSREGRPSPERATQALGKPHRIPGPRQRILRRPAREGRALVERDKCGFGCASYASEPQ